MRLADGEPLVYNRTYLPEKIWIKGLYMESWKKYHQISVLAFEDVQAVNLTKEEANLLHVKENTSSLKINRKAINDKNIPIEFTQALARGDKFVYRSKQYND